MGSVKLWSHQTVKNLYSSLRHFVEQVACIVGSAKMAARYRARSISLPSGSHHSTARIDEELSKAKRFDFDSVSTSGSICSGLSCLEDLYTAVDELLNMNSTQQVLSSHGDHVDELLDGSVQILDVCGVLRDLMVQVKECVRSLQSALRRRKADDNINTSVASYGCFRKKLKKDARKMVSKLKQTPCVHSSISGSGDHHLATVIRVLEEVSAVIVCVFKLMLMFLSAPAPAKGSRWSFVSKLKHKGSVACEEYTVNELEGVDCALSGLCRSGGDAENVQIARKRLEGLEMSIEGFEYGLECLFRHLIKTRASLLNIISQ